MSYSVQSVHEPDDIFLSVCCPINFFTIENATARATTLINTPTSTF